MLQNEWIIFSIGILVTWRLTHLLSKEDGPFDIIFFIRKKAGAGFFGNLLDCFYCLSIWGAILPAVYIGEGLKETILLWLAFSGAACLLEKITGSKTSDTVKQFYKED